MGQILGAVSGGRRARGRKVVDAEAPSNVPGSITLTDTAGSPLSALALAEGGTFDIDAIVTATNGNLMPSEPLTWASTNTNVATVNSSGVVTAVASGTCAISATAANAVSVSSSAAITVAAAAVASVGVTPTSLALVAGAVTTLAYQPRDASGNALAGRTLTAVSSNTGVATVSVNGYTVTVTAVAAGTATITGTCETVDAAGVTATITSAAGAHPNLPPGFTEVTEQDYSLPYAADNIGTGWYAVATSNVTRVDDQADLTRSSSYAYRIRYPKSTVLGTGTLDAGGASSVTLPSAVRGLVTQYDGVTVTGKGSRILETYNPTTGVGTVLVPFDTPATAGDAFEALFQDGPLKGGTGPCNFGIAESVVAGGWTVAKQGTELYLDLDMKISANWFGNRSGVNKVFYGIAGGTAGAPFYLSAQCVGTDPIQMQVRTQGCPMGQITRTLGAAGTVVRGTAFRLTLYCKMNTTTGGIANADGILTGWINNVQVRHSSTMKWRGNDAVSGNVTLDGALWDQIKWNPIWGGGTGPIPADQYMWQGYAYIATKA